MSYIRTAIFITFILGAKYASAQTSLYIPGSDYPPLSVNVVGVGSDGRTTWQIVPGEATQAATDPNIGTFVGTATLVEGPSDAVLSYVYPPGSSPVIASCDISGGTAVCVIPDEPPLTITQSAVPVAVQGGGPLSGAATPSATPSDTSSDTSSGSSSAASGPLPSVPTPTPTPTPAGSSQSGNNNTPLPTTSSNTGSKNMLSYLVIAGAAALGTMLM